tara:strand:+ start:224 stop:1267 length:1044 start_codon:yes stop_codon:yes gene_type:complete
MKLKKEKDIKKIIIKLGSTIKSAINNLNNSGLKIVLVTDENNKLLGTIVDGDIRRGLLNGLDLTGKIDDIIFRNPNVTNIKTSNNQAIEIMKMNYLNHLPIVDENNKPIGLHTVEEVVGISERDNKVLIMAGGFGKRLLPQTNKVPKALIEVYGKPMLENIVLKIKKSGFRNFIFSTHYLGDKIKDHFSTGEKLNVKIEYIEEKKPLGTAGSLCYLKNLSGQNVLVTNCDVISEIDYSEAIDYHEFHKADATMAVNRFETQNPYGVIETDGNIFKSYHEKPIKHENINAGIYIFKSEVFKYIDDEKYLDMPDFFAKLLKLKKKVIVYPIYEKWQDMGQKEQVFKIIK